MEKTTRYLTAVFTFRADDEEYTSEAPELVDDLVDMAQARGYEVELNHGRELPVSGARYAVSEEDGGFGVVRWSGGHGWGIGHTFSDRASAEIAAATLNGLLSMESARKEAASA